MSADYDYIIAGAGSAGCTLANRLVNAGKRVLVVEAGPADNTRLIDMPATFAKVIGTWRDRSRERRELTLLDARSLRDLGLNPSNIQFEASKPFWRV